MNSLRNQKFKRMNPKHEWFKLNKRITVVLFLYYLLLLATSIYLLFDKLFSQRVVDNNIVFTDSIFISVIASVLGSTIYYVRKLYKSCINLDVQKPTSDEDKTRQIGVFFYFFLRPIFSGAFAIIVLIIIKSGISILSNTKSLSSEFYYLAIVISFFVGFSCGDLIDKFEVLGEKIVNKVSELKV